MPSLNLDLNYFDHQKAMRLESKLGHGADVLPIRLWAYVGRQNPQHGRLSMLEAELERVCRWWGKKGDMVRAMIEIGFLERDGDFYQVHDWHDHSGHLATFKKRAIKAARKRWGIKRKSSNATSNASSSPKQCPSSAVHSSAVHSSKTSTTSCELPPKSAADSPTQAPNDFGPENVMRLWNRMAHPALARVKLLPRTREAHIKARLQDFPAEPDWIRIIERVNQSSFLTGQKTKWRVHFDWVLNPQNITKIMEGNYDDVAVGKS